MRTYNLVLLAILMAFGACKKDNKKNEPAPETTTGSESTAYYVRMTDAPGPYKAINIDLRAVELVSATGTVTLNTNTRVYNLLNFSNGIDTLIASGSLTIDNVKEIHLVLGGNNTLITSDGIPHLLIMSAAQTTLTLPVNQSLQAGSAFTTLIDFDVARSVSVQGTNYYLNPVIRNVNLALSGSIKGKISEGGVFTKISATLGSNTYAAFANANGEFYLQGLPPGKYTLYVNPDAPYDAKTLTNVNVATGLVTDVGVISI